MRLQTALWMNLVSSKTQSLAAAELADLEEDEYGHKLIEPEIDPGEQLLLDLVGWCEVLGLRRKSSESTATGHLPGLPMCLRTRYHP